MRILTIASLILVLWMVSGIARAESIFVPRLENYHLKEQLAEDTKRMIPQGEMYSAAIDVDIWKYFNDDYYYHGPGYWADAYAELRPFDDLRINTKFTFANGSTSYGYNQRDLNTLFFGVTWSPDILPELWNFEVQFFDLDRVTLGAGLFFEDREMSGMALNISEENWGLNIRLPGTAVLQTFGDLWSMEVYRQSSANVVGFHGFLVQDYAYVVPDPFIVNGYTLAFSNLEPVGSLFIRSKEHLFTQYRMEAAYGSNQKAAGLAGVGIQQTRNCRFCYSLMAQYRYFQDDIVEGIAGTADYDYIPYSMHDRPYDNPINAFRIKDEVHTYSLTLAFKTPLGGRWYFESHNEVGQFDYVSSAADGFVFHKQSVGYCPYEKYKENCLQLFISNKTINALSPYSRFNPGRPIYDDVHVLGIHGVFFL